MSDFLSDIDKAKLIRTHFWTISAVCSLIKVLVYNNETLSGWCLRELKKKGKVQLVNPKGSRDRLRECSLTRVFHCKV